MEGAVSSGASRNWFVGGDGTAAVGLERVESTICLEARRLKLSFVDEMIFFAVACCEALLDRLTFGFTGESMEEEESVEDVPTFCTPPNCVVVRESVSSSSSSSSSPAMPAPKVHDVNMERNVCSKDAGTVEGSQVLPMGFTNNDVAFAEEEAAGVPPFVMAVSKLRRISRADCCNRAMVSGCFSGNIDGTAGGDGILESCV